jgi:hypothetical protein
MSLALFTARWMMVPTRRARCFGGALRRPRPTVGRQGIMPMPRPRGVSVAPGRGAMHRYG